MLFSRLFVRTLRDFPRATKTEGYGLLVRGSYVRALGQGLYSLLPLGMRVAAHIERIIREEMTALDGQEMLLPLVNPRGIWERSGRLSTAASDLVTFSDADGRELVLAPTHEEAAVATVREFVRSYRDFPVLLYQFQTKFRDERQSRCGIVRAREFRMKDAYSFHRTFSDLNNFFPRVYHAYERIFSRCSVPTVAADAASGYMAGDRSYEFLMESECGDDVAIRCSSCGYTANCEVAVGRREPHIEAPLPMEEAAILACRSPEDARRGPDAPGYKLAKSVVYRSQDGLLMAVVRGDYDVSEEKLAVAAGTPIIGLAESDELEGVGLIPGSLSPVGLAGRLPVYIDTSVAETANLVYGANRAGRQFINVNFGRDYGEAVVTDLARIRNGNRCLHCGSKLREFRALELGHIFRLGDRYSRSLDLRFQEEDGTVGFPHMGSYGIGIGRLIAAIVEANHDKKGILWPAELSPYRAYLLAIGRSTRIRSVAEKLHAEHDQSMIFDDRDESVGSRFRDADLLGIPYRIVVSSRTLEDGNVEVMERRSGTVTRLPAAAVGTFLDKPEKT